jgi:hypothetical protein
MASDTSLGDHRHSTAGPAPGPTPILVQNPMYLLPGRAILVRATEYSLHLRTSPEGPDTIIFPTTGTIIIAPKRPRGRKLYIVPSKKLGTGFRDGWRKLPDELKVTVLEHNLVAEKPISQLSRPRIRRRSVEDESVIISA